MIRVVKGSINKCTCDECGHKWDTLKVPGQCPKCRSREWNGKKRTGRPPRGEMAKIARKLKAAKAYLARKKEGSQ